jgi:hypothetical protein
MTYIVSRLPISRPCQFLYLENHSDQQSAKILGFIILVRNLARDCRFLSFPLLLRIPTQQHGAMEGNVPFILFCSFR